MTFTFDDKTGLTPEEQASVEAASWSTVNQDPGLPGELDAIAWAIHRASDANISLARMQVLAVAASCVQGHYNVETHWHNSVPTNLYTFTVAEPNERKSSAYDCAMEGPCQWDKQAELDHKTALARYLSDKAQAKKEGLDFLEQAPTRDLRKLGNATIETVVSDMEKPNGVMIWATDEAAQVLGGYSMKSESAMHTFGILNALWQGKTYTMRRRTQGNVRIETPRLTISFAGQPNTAHLLLGNKDAEGTGFLARFLFLNPPPRRAHRDMRKPLTKTDEAKILGFKDWTLSWMEKPLPMDENDMHRPRTFPASEEAKRLGKAFEHEMEVASDPGQKYHGFYQAGKAHDQAYRIAGICALYRGASEVGAGDITKAIAVMRFYLNEVLTFMEGVGGSQASRDAETVMQWMRERQAKKGQAHFTKLDVTNNVPRPLRFDKPRLWKAVAYAVEEGRLELASGGDVGKGPWQIPKP